MMLLQSKHIQQNTTKLTQYSRLTDKQKHFVRSPESEYTHVPIKILIVEDTIICQKLALSMLKKPAYNAELAVTGEEALAKYQEGYDVILLDLGLPDISGITVCRYIRQKIGDLKIPVIAYSTMSDSLREECFEAGFSEVLTKPCSAKQLNAVIQRLMINSNNK